MKKITQRKVLTRREVQLSQEELVDDLITPLSSFDQEVIYQYTVEQENSLKLFNKNYGNLLYGRKDEKGNVILPNTGYFSQNQRIRSAPFCFNFVSDAYEDFVRSWRGYVNAGIIKENDDLSIEAVKGYVNFEDLYENKFKEYSSIFLQFVKLNNLNKEIVDWNSFLNQFSKFISSLCPSNPVTPSNFIESRYCDDHISGLVLSFADKDSNKYSNKQDFLDNINFNIFNQLANIHGFILDKNEPWKLYFNIYSPKAMEYFEKYKRETDFFKSFFLKAQLFDLYYFRKNIMELYNMFVTNKPSIMEKTLESCKGETVTKTRKIERSLLSKDFMQAELNNKPDIKWWRLYVYSLICEKNVSMTQQRFDQIVMDSHKLYITLDMDEALRYLNSLLRSAPPARSKERNFSF